MKLICTDGRFLEYEFPHSEDIHQGWLQQLLHRHVRPDGTLDCLCLDFCGAYVPLHNEQEMRLASALLVAYHNRHGREYPQVCSLLRVCT